MDELISRRALRTPFLRMVRDGAVLPAAQYTRGGGAGASITDQAADDRVLALLADGATLILQGLHRTWPPLADFARKLIAELGHPVQINAYVTPPGSRGFGAHYDVHDVFVLQVAGCKHWRIHDPVLADPLPEQSWQQRRAEVASRAAEPPLLDTTLEPGDALYLPRGYLHAADAQQDTSIHLTVGIHPITGYQLARYLLDAACDDRALRAALPAGADLTDPAVLGLHLQAAADAVCRALDAADPARLADCVRTHLARETRPAPVAPLAQLAAADAIAARSRLLPRPGQRWRLDRDGDELRLRLHDKDIRFPAAAESALREALRGPAFTPCALPGLDADDQLALCRRLLREGVVVPG